MTHRNRLFVTVLMASLILFGVGSAAADTENDLARFHPFTVDDSNDTCIDYNDPQIGYTRNCDPVNLVFLDMNVSEVENVLEAESWSNTSIGSIQSLHYASGLPLYDQDSQLVFQESWTKRYHIRLWQVPGETLTLGAVHHESGFFTHTIDKSWEDSERFVRDQLCGATFVCSTGDELPLQSAIQADQSGGNENMWRGWESDGKLTVIGVDTTNQSPAIQISGPGNGSSFDEGTQITFVGAASDDEDGDLTTNLVWSSNLDGQIGTGGSFGAVLSVGTHIVSATVTDSGGASGTESITVTVNPAASEQLIVAATTDKETYSNREQANIEVVVTDGQNGVPGAAVLLEITTAKGRIQQLEGATDNDGIAIFSFKVNSKSGGTGLYSISAQASKSGYVSGVGTATFSVQ